MTGVCQLPTCETRVGRGQLMCRPHWFKVPQRLRQEVNAAWRLFRKGSEHRIAYFEVRDEAIRVVAEQEGVAHLFVPDAPRMRLLQAELEKRR